MKIEIKMPWGGTEGLDINNIIKEWKFISGDIVKENEIIVIIENEIAFLELPADGTGKIFIKKQEGEAVKVGDVLCIIEIEENA